MSAPDTIAPPGLLSESQRAALLTLLADEDRATYQSIRQKILSQGPAAAGWLRAYCLSDDPILRRRVQEILRQFDLQEADNRFVAFCLKQGQDCALEEGAWLLAETEYPDINTTGYQAVLDDYAQVLRDRLRSRKEAREMLGVINEFLFDELGFTGNEENYYDPQNSYLNRVLDRRTGNPISLCLVYMLLARRLELPIVGIGLPGHFICRYQSSSSEIYIDPFGRGKLLAKADCIQYLLQSNYNVRDEYLAPTTPRRMLLRMCANLRQIYGHLGKTEESTRLQRYLVALSK